MNPSPYLLKVTLKQTPKLIWRRFVVPADIRLDHLHDVLQTVMGWSEPRPHVFFQKKQGFYPTGQITDGGLLEKKYTLSNLVVRSGGKLKYIYDTVEEKWIHEVVVEDVRFSDPAWSYPVCCIAGVRACPPLEVGGHEGFVHLLRTLDGKVQDEELKGRFIDFQPDHFDLDRVNRAFGVDGPRRAVPKAFQPPPPKKPTGSKQVDLFYRLGQKLKKMTSSDIE